MKISKRQLKRIIREEYSRLKSQGLINEMSGVAFPDPELEQDTPYDRLMDGAENEPYDGYVEAMAAASSLRPFLLAMAFHNLRRRQKLGQ